MHGQNLLGKVGRGYLPAAQSASEFKANADVTPWVILIRLTWKLGSDSYTLFCPVFSNFFSVAMCS